jgi:hypothetical protein
MYTSLTSRPLSYRVNMLRFLETESAGADRQQRVKRHADTTLELARFVIDAMAVAGCDAWDNDIAWQTARELLHNTPDDQLAAIIDRVQFELLAA